ncbi:MAG: phosphoribosylglycinamide formyltransferase [Lachnospiraceae bacterium]|jgi:phosphoribosylglycinamide formyltransferase-1|nr:phosphoribosylglycinamide formyltransferase [Lachnospiraceae bacterium]
MLRVVVCVSGGGTNLQAIIDRCADGTIRNAQIVRVISNKKDAFALERAKKAGIPGICISPKDYSSREEFNLAFQKGLDEAEPDLIVLAGFLVQVPRNVVAAYPGKIINIHPALIPSFCGKGFYGLRVHEAALARGVKVTGATVHFVDENMDSGPIIIQKAVDIPEGITAQDLQQKVMREAEWIILPKAIDLIAQGRVVLDEKTKTTHILPE